MSGDSVTFRLDGEVTISALADALSRFKLVLDELQRDHSATVTWVVAGLDYGSASATAQALAADDHSAALVPGMVDDYLASARRVSLGETDQGKPLLRLVRNLAELADEANPLTLETDDDEVVFSLGPGSDTDPVPQPQDTKALGTVRGRVETLSHRRGLTFTVYALVDDRAVRCHLQAGDEQLMRDAWGRIADVSGLVTFDGVSGRPRNVRQVTSIEIVEDGDPMGFLDAQGVVGGSEPAEQSIRRIRDAS